MGNSTKLPDVPMLQTSNVVPQFPPNRFDDTGFAPTKMCQWWKADPQTCQKGSVCTYAHGVHELKPGCPESRQNSRFLHMSYTPSQMCPFFEQTGQCPKGLTCSLAHGKHELV